MSTGPLTLDVHPPRPPLRLRRALTALASMSALARVAIGGAETVRADSVDAQPYTADDGCYYVVQDGQWIGGSCMVTYIDAAGVSVEGVYSVHAYDPAAAGHLGALVMQVDLRDPAYVVYRNPSAALFEGGVWARQVRADLTAPVEVTVWDDGLGGWRWQVLPPAPSTSTGPVFVGGYSGTADIPVGGGGTAIVVGGGGGGTSTGVPQIDALVQGSNQRQTDTILSPDCGSDTIWCH